MAKKPSGLGRGLGELMEDNAPEIHGGGTVVKREGAESIVITPTSGGPLDTAQVKKPKGLYDDLPKTNSLKANFKNFK
ncbi:MAG: hypothetical protein E7668_01490 [Ruminococcaceae bacterium]|nr:hypothetical protein [Oscillospiraceae bacterium]